MQLSWPHTVSPIMCKSNQMHPMQERHFTIGDGNQHGSRLSLSPLLFCVHLEINKNAEKIPNQGEPCVIIAELINASSRSQCSQQGQRIVTVRPKRGLEKGFTQAHWLRVIYLIRFLIKYLSEKKGRKKMNFFFFYHLMSNSNLFGDRPFL